MKIKILAVLVVITVVVVSIFIREKREDPSSFKTIKTTMNQQFIAKWQKQRK